MKKLFLSLVAVMVATVSFAQNTLVATLTHDDNIRMFYGTYALQQAHAATANGDVITRDIATGISSASSYPTTTQDFGVSLKFSLTR